MRTNVATKQPPIHTHEGGVASHINVVQQLRRSIMACMLFEGTFYESGVEIATRISDLVKQCKPAEVAALAIEAREKMKLRHAPLWLVSSLLKDRSYQGKQMGDLIHRVINRADEPGELISMYWKDQPNAPLPAQLKVGLARALKGFSAYELAKYNRDAAVKLRDVMFLVHPRPKNDGHAQLLKSLAENTLESPDTWEVALSAGKDKKETFERLMRENKLGALAFLRNLRNMKEAGVDRAAVLNYGGQVSMAKVLPFRFLSAARAVPMWEDLIEPWMLRAAGAVEKLPGKTLLMVDGSGSMTSHVSGKSDLTRYDAACALAILLREICEEVVLVKWGDQIHVIPPRRGFALRDAFGAPDMGTQLAHCLTLAKTSLGPVDRCIVLTDEQSADGSTSYPAQHRYIVNVAAYKNGVGYHEFTHIDGWSEAIIDYIRQFESAE